MGIKEAISNLAKKTVDFADKQVKLIKINNQIQENKKDLLNRFSDKQIKALAREQRIKEYKTIDGKEVPFKVSEFKAEILHRATSTELIDFANRKSITDTYTFQQRYDDLLQQKEVVKAGKKKEEIEGGIKEGKKEIFDLVVAEIQEFHPKRSHYVESNYQNSLCGFLQKTFPETEMETQIGSSRPDLCIKDIGIEIKGPTGDFDLQTIADKLLRYPQFFRGGIIVVLFDVHVHPRRYAEWLKGIKEKYPEIVVIRK